MEGLSFVFQRFFISFLGGCIVNFYVIIYCVVLKDIDILPCFLENILFSEGTDQYVHVLAFIIIAIIISILIEGICQIGIGYYFDLINENKIFKSENKNKYTFYAWPLRFFVIKATIYEASKDFFDNYILSRNGKDVENPMDKFITDSGIQLNSQDDFYDAINMCAKVIEKDGRVADIYRFRDTSYIIQMIRLSFLLIAITTIAIGIYFFIVGNLKPLLGFIGYCLIISMVLIFMTTRMSHYFGKRYIRDVGKVYKALTLNLPTLK